MTLQNCKKALLGLIFAVQGMAHAANLQYAPYPVVTANYGINGSVPVTITLSGSSQEPQIQAETSGTVSTCQIYAIERSANRAIVTIGILGATSTTNTCRIIATQKGDGVIADASENRVSPCLLPFH